MKYIKFIAVAVIISLAACSGSKVLTSWGAPDATPKKYNKIMVLGLISDEDRVIRDRMEKHLVADLKDVGYNAVSALETFGPKAFENMCEKDVIERIKGNGVDAVITIVLMNKEKEQRYVSGGQNYVPSIYHNSFGGYYTSVFERITTPGYYVSTTNYFWESNMYEMPAKNLLYSVRTESFDPATSDNLAHDYGKLIVANMVKKNILARQ